MKYHVKKFEMLFSILINSGCINIAIKCILLGQLTKRLQLSDPGKKIDVTARVSDRWKQTKQKPDKKEFYFL